MDIKILEEARKVDSENIVRDILVPIKDEIPENQWEITAISVAYVLYNLNDSKNFDGLKKFLSEKSFSEDIKNILEKYLSNHEDLIISKIGKYTQVELLSVVLFYEPYSRGMRAPVATPDYLLKLAERLLDMEDGDEILDLCSGTAGLLREISAKDIDFKYIGVDLNYIVGEIAKLRASILEKDANLILWDALEYDLKEKKDKLFSNYPFDSYLKNSKEYIETLAKELDIEATGLGRISSDWIFNLSLICHMKDTGKAVAIMRNGATWNDFDKSVRKYFVENGLIESVISLPEKLLPNTMIPITMMVFSKNNETVRFLDATKVFTEGRRMNSLSDDDINKIISNLSNDNEISVEKNIKEIAENDYILNASRYLIKDLDIKNGVELGSVIKNITRGSQLKAKEIDELASEDPTKFKYLMLSNIQNGILDIDGENQYLKDMPEKLEKYCVKNRSIILSKIGMPSFKTAVAEVEADTKLLATGNVFVIEVDESKIDPYYLQAFFASDYGTATFKKIYTGGVLPSISILKLKQIMVPLPPMEEQKKIANKYAATIDEYALLKRKLDKVINKLNHVYDEGE